MLVQKKYPCTLILCHFSAPNLAPKNVDVSRLNVSHMNITWVKLTLEEARGFITGYIVSYDTLESRRRKEAVVEIIHPEGSYKVIGGLGFTTSYSVTVSASTTAGQGISSRPIMANGNKFTLSCMVLYGRKLLRGKICGSEHGHENFTHENFWGNLPRQFYPPNC